MIALYTPKAYTQHFHMVVIIMENKVLSCHCLFLLQEYLRYPK